MLNYKDKEVTTGMLRSDALFYRTTLANLANMVLRGKYEEAREYSTVAKRSIEMRGKKAT
jgi:hypothetical protein